MIKEKAYAKINLYLDVTSRREDGFHNIKSIMHSVELFDEMTFNIKPSKATSVTLEIEGNDSIPTDGTNLVTKAVKKYLSSICENADVAVKLLKRIPSGAGLGGGSSDAAGALRAMNRFFDNRLSAAELLSLASELGSDVPYCVFGGTALCEGRGEIISPIEKVGKRNFVVAIGSGRVSTPEAYSLLDLHYSSFDGSLPSGGEEHLSLLLGNLGEGRLSSGLFNIFEGVIEKELPEVKKLKSDLIFLGASCALMSGSGPSVFAIFDSYTEAENAASVLRKRGITAFSAMSI